jgi:hypothetical protein
METNRPTFYKGKPPMNAFEANYVALQEEGKRERAEARKQEGMETFRKVLKSKRKPAMYMSPTEYMGIKRPIVKK